MIIRCGLVCLVGDVSIPFPVLVVSEEDQIREISSSNKLFSESPVPGGGVVFLKVYSSLLVAPSCLAVEHRVICRRFVTR